MTIKVAITDDHPMVISGLKNALSASKEISVTGTYANGNDLLNSLETTRPDVLLLDLQLPDFSGKEIARKIFRNYPDIKIIILSSIEEAFSIEEMMEMGCSGYLLKSSTDQTILLQAVEAAYYGEIYLEASLKKELLTGILKTKKKSEKTSAMLTQKEKEIMGFIIEGYSSKKIAGHLGISYRTVETHRFSLLQKLEVKNTAELVKKAMELHLLK